MNAIVISQSIQMGNLNEIERISKLDETIYSVLRA